MKETAFFIAPAAHPAFAEGTIMSVAIPTSLKIRLLERGYVSFRAWARQHEVSFETARDIASGRISCARNPKRGSARHVLEIMINDLGYDPREHHKQAA